MPGGLGINLLNSFIQAGLKDKIPVISAFTADEATLPVLKDNAIGVYGVLTWAPNMDNRGQQEIRLRIRSCLQSGARILRHAGL